MTDTAKETVFEHKGIMYGDKPVVRCYSVRHGYSLVCRADDFKKDLDSHDRVIGKTLVAEGYVMRFANHRCDVPIEELANALLIRDGDPKAKVMARRGSCGEGEFKTADELAKIVDRADDTFVPEMYRLSVACGKIRADSGDRRFDMSEGLFIKTLKTELRGLGYEIES